MIGPDGFYISELKKCGMIVRLRRFLHKIREGTGSIPNSRLLL